MIFSLVSIVLSAVSLALILLHYKNNRRNTPNPAEATAASVRIMFYLCLCAVPLLAFISMQLNSVKWAYYTESAVIAEGAATLLIGLMALLQRYGAILFKMPVAMEKNEILFMIFFPLAVYLSYRLAFDFIAAYYLAPGIYSLFMLFWLTGKTKERA